MIHKIIAAAVLTLGLAAAASTTVASADPPGMTHDSACRTVTC